MNTDAMPSQDPALESFREDVLEAGHEELLDNEERGCGHLDHNATYVRSDVSALSGPEGEVPRFVTLDQPVPYREYSGRGAIIPGWRKFPGVEFATAYVNSGRDTTPEGAIPEHHNRLAAHIGFDGDHYGEITAARAYDLLMSVGETHWSTPAEYIEETRERGLNLKVPSGPNHEPPVVNPMVTRCWVVHPKAVPITDSAHGGDTHNAGEEVVGHRAGIIGYAVLTRCVFTTGEAATADDPDIPTYAEEWAENARVSLATPGEEIPAEPEGDPTDDGDDAQTGVGDWEDGPPEDWEPDEDSVDDDVPDEGDFGGEIPDADADEPDDRLPDESDEAIVRDVVNTLLKEESPDTAALQGTLAGVMDGLTEAEIPGQLKEATQALSMGNGKGAVDALLELSFTDRYECDDCGQPFGTQPAHASHRGRCEERNE